MANTDTLTLSVAEQMIDAALATGRKHKFMPLTVAVLDAGGHLIALKREDGSGIMRVEIATGKAWGALGMGQSGRTLRDRLSDRQYFMNSLSAASGGRFIPVPGGVLIKSNASVICGAIGISGDTSDKDEVCAIAGVHAAGFASDPAEPVDGWEKSKL